MGFSGYQTSRALSILRLFSTATVRLIYGKTLNMSRRQTTDDRM